MYGSMTSGYSFILKSNKKLFFLTFLYIFNFELITIDICGSMEVMLVSNGLVLQFLCYLVLVVLVCAGDYFNL